MTEQEWLNCNNPTTMLDLVRPTSSERKLRLFSVACCRRVWHLLANEHLRQAVEVAERYADGTVSSGEWERIRAAVQNVFREAKDEEYGGEVEAGFDDSPSYSAICTRLFVSAAVRATVSTRAYQSLELLDAYRQDEAEWSYGDEGRRGCDYWAAAAMGRAARHGIYIASGAKTREDLSAKIRKKARRAEEEAIPLESAGQAIILRDLYGDPFTPFTVLPAYLAWNDSTVLKLAQFIYDKQCFQDLPNLADALEEAGCTEAIILNHLRQSGEHVRGCWVVDLVLGKT